MRIPDRYKQGDGIYKTVIAEPYKYKKKTAKTDKPKTKHRAVFALWNGEDWCAAAGSCLLLFMGWVRFGDIYWLIFSLTFIG